jgi:hypothetical protein
MKYIKTFNDRDNNNQKIDYSNISLYIREEIDLGKTKPYEIEHSLYKSGDYICSSFKINGRDVIVSSIVINDIDTICVNGGRHYNTLVDYISQFGLETDRYLYIGFGEYINGQYNDDKNVNDNTTLFRKMSTIIEVIKSMALLHGVKYIIFNSVENDLESGIKRDYNKRCKFYELFLSYTKVKYHKIKKDIEVNGEIISDFFLLCL